MSDDYLLIGGDLEHALAVINQGRASAGALPLDSSYQLDCAASKHVASVNAGGKPTEGFPAVVWAEGYEKFDQGNNVAVGVYGAPVSSVTNIVAQLLKNSEKPGEIFKGDWDQVGIASAGDWTVVIYGRQRPASQQRKRFY